MDSVIDPLRKGIKMEVPDSKYSRFFFDAFITGMNNASQLYKY